MGGQQVRRLLLKAVMPAFTVVVVLAAVGSPVCHMCVTGNSQFYRASTGMMNTRAGIPWTFGNCNWKPKQALHAFFRELVEGCHHNSPPFMAGPVFTGVFRCWGGKGRGIKVAPSHAIKCTVFRCNYVQWALSECIRVVLSRDIVYLSDNNDDDDVERAPHRTNIAERELTQIKRDRGV